jgi:hypothetical protein
LGRTLYYHDADINDLKETNKPFFPRSTKKVYDALTSPKSHIKFTEEEGAEEHCQGGAPPLSN